MEGPRARDSSLVNQHTRDLLLWVEREPRTYSEAVETWRTSCPRFSTWEDAIADELVAVVRNGSVSTVVVTALGRRALAKA